MDMSATTKVATRQDFCANHGEFESKALVLLGKLMGWSKCPECNRLAAEADAETKRLADEQERQRRMEKRLNRAGIPLRFRSRSFDNFVVEAKAQCDCLTIASEFAADFCRHAAAGTAMVFSGKPGTGKSHLAIAACMAIMAAGYTALYLNALDAIRLVRSTWKRDAEIGEADVMRDLASVDLLVLDEVGAQYGTEGEQVILFDIINRRYQDQMPMILLTNQGKDGFQRYLGDRAFDRLREGGRWVPFDWPSFRGAK